MFYMLSLLICLAIGLYAGLQPFRSFKQLALRIFLVAIAGGIIGYVGNYLDHVVRFS